MLGAGNCLILRGKYMFQSLRPEKGAVANYRIYLRKNSTYMNALQWG